MSKQVCELPKNSREDFRFTWARVVSPALWVQFQAALDQVETAMIEAGWIDRAELEAQS
jgi:hypothetical protein